MSSYKAIYIRLFARTEDAIIALERGDAERAQQILIDAQQEAEEAVMKLDE